MSVRYVDTNLPDLLGRPSLRYAEMSMRDTSKCACVIQEFFLNLFFKFKYISIPDTLYIYTGYIIYLYRIHYFIYTGYIFGQVVVNKIVVVIFFKRSFSSLFRESFCFHNKTIVFRYKTENKKIVFCF